jgi:hypothetical protein
MASGPSLTEALLATGGLVAAVAFMNFAGVGAMRARGEHASIRGWIVRLWVHGVLVWALIFGALRSWGGEFWVALDDVKAGRGDSTLFTIGMICAIGALVTLFGLAKVARQGVGEPIPRPGDGPWPPPEAPEQAKAEKEERDET